MTPEDRRYFEALESGDLTTAQRLVAEAAERAGYWPQILYHQGPPGITQFRESLDGELGRGIYLTASEDYARMISEIKPEASHRYQCFVRITRPFRTDNSVRIALGLATSPEIRPKLERLGYDSVIRDSFQIVAQQVLVFSPQQIKPADTVLFDAQGRSIWM